MNESRTGLARAATWRPSITAALRQHLTPRLGAALVLWRIEAALATPLALVLVAAMGRWPAALAMGLIMAVFAAIFLFLLSGQSALLAFQEWVYAHPLVQRFYLPVSRPGHRFAVPGFLLLILVAILLIGPFWRAMIFHSMAMRKETAYLLSVLGSIPHSLLWTGLVLGGLWEGVIWPLLDSYLV